MSTHRYIKDEIGIIIHLIKKHESYMVLIMREANWEIIQSMYDCSEQKMITIGIKDEGENDSKIIKIVIAYTER